MAKALWKTTCIIWTDYDPRQLELNHLAQEAQTGNAYCSKQHIELVPDVEKDADWDENEFFAAPDRFE